MSSKTKPEKRTQAVLAAEVFLCAMVTNQAEVFNAEFLRACAADILEDFPRSGDLLQSSAALPNIWGTPDLSPFV
jgi:hypothetical protein